MINKEILFNEWNEILEFLLLLMVFMDFINLFSKCCIDKGRFFVKELFMLSILFENNGLLFIK